MKLAFKNSISSGYCPSAMFGATPEQILAWCNQNIPKVFLDVEFWKAYYKFKNPDDRQDMSFHMVLWRGFITHLGYGYPAEEFFV